MKLGEVKKLVNVGKVRAFIKVGNFEYYKDMVGKIVDKDLINPETLLNNILHNSVGFIKLTPADPGSCRSNRIVNVKISSIDSYEFGEVEEHLIEVEDD